jgi:hypothetical protein
MKDEERKEDREGNGREKYGRKRQWRKDSEGSKKDRGNS